MKPLLITLLIACSCVTNSFAQLPSTPPTAATYAIPNYNQENSSITLKENNTVDITSKGTTKSFKIKIENGQLKLDNKDDNAIIMKMLDITNEMLPPKDNLLPIEILLNEAKTATSKQVLLVNNTDEDNTIINAPVEEITTNPNERQEETLPIWAIGGIIGGLVLGAIIGRVTAKSKTDEDVLPSVTQINQDFLTQNLESLQSKNEELLKSVELMSTENRRVKEAYALQNKLLQEIGDRYHTPFKQALQEGNKGKVIQYAIINTQILNSYIQSFKNSKSSTDLYNMELVTGKNPNTFPNLEIITRDTPLDKLPKSAQTLRSILQEQQITDLQNIVIDNNQYKNI